MHSINIIPGLVCVLLVTLPVAGCQSAPPKQEPAPRPCAGLIEPHSVQIAGRSAFEVQVKMNVDVDGAPNAYGPKHLKTLDTLDHALSPKSPGHPREVVGYMTDYDGGPPTIQGKNDPYPGYYVSQTDFADSHNPRMEDPRRYLDASRINYVVLGQAAMDAGVKLGDFVVAYSCRTGKSAFAIVGDSGNPSGAEGSLALVQALGYHILDGKKDSVDEREIVIDYYPKSNPVSQFFKSQAALDEAAMKAGLRK